MNGVVAAVLVAAVETQKHVRLLQVVVALLI